MRIRNLSGIKIPKQLWVKLASILGLSSTLPQAFSDELGMYRTARSLRVSINRRVVGRHDIGESVVGTYTFGHISLFPCARCSVGFLTYIYLHELCHAWIHQVHEAIYETFDSCDFCDRFADDAYRILSGKSPGGFSCAEFPLFGSRTDLHIAKVKQAADTFLGLSDTMLIELLKAGPKRANARKAEK